SKASNKVLISILIFLVIIKLPAKFSLFKCLLNREHITNNQEQIEPSLITPKKLIKTELKGKVKSSGMIYYELETSTADNIEWLDFILPEMFDDESMDVTFEEKKLRLEF
ncbi:hypothetical protein, partial [Mammaliicoccus lentus]|uniref:hypothetical protein n=1 Tax=Mammaliicoccus lentus TaxID=42858 RepID=UPI003F5432D7